MLNLTKIKEITEEFFLKMTITPHIIEAHQQEENIVDVNIKIDEPQILIGEKGQTLFEMQRLLKTILNKKLEAFFYLNLDINEYKSKKIEYLKDLATQIANEVALTKEEKVLLPMPAYERRVIHKELSQRPDILAESQGEGQDRHIVIKLR